ncbi:MAG: Trk system potassium transporter TrkA [Candidatus Marinimicrobia bacterium]|jgi:trk system potassium uptake protein TrkA|nr:Trk system potassium transporter TrkA [Candidatus Neomarinimicrobiota bacterium]MEC7935164.1 Trk system potassium transporter TrkA [Candidatus Neomarinimicrobiota bacterium]MEC9106610.1 Trk system potassium transporter TrkA [Candidatus Neomarinimicrobiota bacterium]MED5256091.1 Trk system potassium transporter TrkA [Candidatus Neomarinimicrobiota bacterium]
MQIVIIGAGEVGFHAAKALSEENHDITAVDILPEKCSRLSENLDVIVVEGNGASPKILHQANVENADYVLCLTRVDEVNLIAAQQAHELGAKKIIARLRNQQYTARNSIIKPEQFGVDLVIHPEKAACDEIIRLVKHPYAVQVMDFEGGRLEMIGIRINGDNGDLLGKSVGEICESNPDFKFGIIAVLREGKTIVPWSDFVFQNGDTPYFILQTEHVGKLMEMLGKDFYRNDRVMILGGSKIGRSVADDLQDEMNVRLVDYNRHKCEWIANELENAMVIEGDGTDLELLKSENIESVDSFIAVTENEQTNLISGLLAHHFGVEQTIIHIGTTEFLPIIQETGIGSVISKNMSTVNSILRKIRSDLSETQIVTFDELDVDVLELTPDKESPVCGKPLSEVSFPKASIVGVINHHGHLTIARGSSQLTEEDTVLVFAKNSVTETVRKLFIA